MSFNSWKVKKDSSSHFLIWPASSTQNYVCAGGGDVCVSVLNLLLTNKPWDTRVGHGNCTHAAGLHFCMAPLEEFAASNLAQCAKYNLLIPYNSN